MTVFVGHSAGRGRFGTSDGLTRGVDDRTIGFHRSTSDHFTVRTDGGTGFDGFGLTDGADHRGSGFGFGRSCAVADRLFLG